MVGLGHSMVMLGSAHSLANREDNGACWTRAAAISMGGEKRIAFPVKTRQRRERRIERGRGVGNESWSSFKDPNHAGSLPHPHQAR